MRGACLTGRCDIVQFALDCQKRSLLDRTEIDRLTLKPECSLAEQAVLENDFRILKEELSVKIHDRRVKIEKWELSGIGSIIEEHFRRDLAAFGNTSCKVCP